MCNWWCKQPFDWVYRHKNWFCTRTRVRLDRDNLKIWILSIMYTPTTLSMLLCRFVCLVFLFVAFGLSPNHDWVHMARSSISVSPVEQVSGFDWYPPCYIYASHLYKDDIGRGGNESTNLPSNCQFQSNTSHVRYWDHILWLGWNLKQGCLQEIIILSIDVRCTVDT